MVIIVRILLGGDMKSVKRTIRACIFVVCLAVFVWEAYKIVAEYLEKEIATKASVGENDNNVLWYNIRWVLREPLCTDPSRCPSFPWTRNTPDLTSSSASISSTPSKTLKKGFMRL